MPLLLEGGDYLLINGGDRLLLEGEADETPDPTDVDGTMTAAAARLETMTGEAAA